MSELPAGTPASTSGERRHYPPGVVFHAPHCLEGGNRPAIPIESAFTTFPTRELHFCFGGMVPEGLLDVIGIAEIMPYIVVEPIAFGDHLYRPSSVKPADSLDYLCAVCRGTHGDEVETLLHALATPSPGR
jgi:hypothetical protein